MIVQGTTPTMTFTLPMETSILAEGYIVVSQNGVPVIEKELAECQVEGRQISAKYTQEETLRLTSGMSVVINVVVKTTGGDRLESMPIVDYVVDTAKNEVI